MLLEVFATFVEGLISSLLIIPGFVSSLVLIIIIPWLVSSFVLIIVVVPVLVSTFVEVRFSSSLLKIRLSALEIRLASLEIRLASLLRFSKRFSLLAEILFDLFFREAFYFFLI